VPIVRGDWQTEAVFSPGWGGSRTDGVYGLAPLAMDPTNG
jgi:hypothetical protein